MTIRCCCASFLFVVACTPSYQGPCSARPGFDQKVRTAPAHVHTNEGPGVVHVPAPRSRADMPATLRAIASALREASDEHPTSVHVTIPLAFFEGLTCAEILGSFGAAHRCTDDPSYAWISLYHLPGNWAGGGRELILHFDGDGYCDGARWCFTQ